MKKNNRAASTIRLKKAIYSPKSTGDSKVGRRNLSGFYVNDSPEESSTRPYENYLDDNLNNKPANSTISLSERHEFTKRSREKLVKKAYCLGNGYKYSFEFSPAINFFKLLCVLPRFRTETNRLFVWIPDTILYNDTDRPYWIYTDAVGGVCREEIFEEGHIIAKLGRAEIGGAPVAVSKKIHFDSLRQRVIGNLTLALDNGELINTIQYVCRRGQDKTCLQKFIRSKGNTAFICRVTYNSKKPPKCFLISSKFSYSSKCWLAESHNSNITRIIYGAFITETGFYLMNLVKFLEKNISIKLEKFVCDFIKDEENVWWMVNVKAFKYSDNTHPILHSFIENDTFYEPSASKLCLKEYKKLKRCEFCRSGFVKMSQELTLKMLFELEDHLKHRGKELSWLENREYRHVDKATLYQRFQVCEDCFKLYTVSQELKTIELSIANGLGIFNEKESRHNNNLSISNLMHLEQFRIIVIFDSIKEHTISFSSMAYVKYSFLGQNSKFHLQAQLGYAQALRHVKIYYCFAKSHKEFEFFLEKHGQITTELYDHNRLIGKTNIPLLDFRSPNVITKTYYQPLSIDTSIYLEAYTGVARDGTQKVNHITFKEHCGVYVCKHHHTSCHPLPSEWFDIMPDWSNLISRSKSSLHERSKTNIINRSRSLMRQIKRNDRISIDIKHTKTFQLF